MRTAVELSVHSPPTIHRGTWEIEGSWVLKGSGDYWTTEARDEDVATLVTEINKYEWLELEPPEPGDTYSAKTLDRNGADALKKFLEQSGAITLEEPPEVEEYPKGRKSWASAAGQFSLRTGLVLSKDEDAMENFLAGTMLRRELGSLLPIGPPPPQRVFLPAFATELALLRVSFKLVGAVVAEAWQTVTRLARFIEPNDVPPSSERSEAEEFVQRWMAEMVTTNVRSHVGIEDPFVEDLRLRIRPARAIDTAWLALATTAGSIQWPGAVEGVYQCSYEPCGKVFRRAPQRMRGRFPFCSVQHSKSHYAARRVREKREEERAAKQATLIPEIHEGEDL